jgi:hypothetical protein
MPPCFLNGILDETLRMVLESELFNRNNTYLTDVIVDTGMTKFEGDAFIGISCEISARLGLVYKGKTVSIWNQYNGKLEECKLTQLSIRLKENTITRFEFVNINAVIVPLLGEDIIIGQDFLYSILNCKRLIVDYEHLKFKIMVCPLK